MKAVLLDVWGTILFRDGISFEEKIARHIDVDYDAFRLWIKTNSHINSNENLQHCLAYELGKIMTLDEIIRIQNQCFEAIYFKNIIFTLIKELKQKVIVGTISNCSYFTPDVLKRLSIKIDHTFWSFDLEVLKPNESFFFGALKELQMSPKDVIMVGNDVQKDIIPANKLGMTTFLINQNKSSYSPATHHISTFEELLTYVSTFV